VYSLKYFDTVGWALGRASGLEKLSDEVLDSCLERGADSLHMVQLMPLYPQTPLSLVSFKSRLVLPSWYWDTQVVLEKRL